eukprot:1156740-Pelagomonas_calceolata.AAC.4
MGLQSSACCRCAASDCCPGLVSSHWTSVGCHACCVAHGVSRDKKEKKRQLEVVLRQPIITHYVHVNQACSPGAFAKSFDDHSSNIVAFCFHAGDGVALAA